MSRGLSAPNLAEVGASHYRPIVMVALEFDTPVYVHNRIGTVTNPIDSNNYLGVGDYGSIEEIRESEKLGPHPIRLTLSAEDAALVAEALDDGNFGNALTIYEGWLDTDGSLVDDPIIAARGKYEYATITTGSENKITITAQNDLAVLDQINGARFTDEDQQRQYPGDLFFQYVEQSIGQKLLIGGRDGGGPGSGGGPVDPWDGTGEIR